MLIARMAEVSGAALILPIGTLAEATAALRGRGIVVR